MYQTMSSENLGSSSVRKTNTNNFKSSREDHLNGVENGRIASTSGNVAPAATTTTTTGASFEGNGNNHHHHHHHHQQQSAASSSSAAVHQSHESSPSRSSSVCLGGGGSGDMLLQWGQNKRSRCSRTEGRSMVSVVPEKHNTNNNNPIMPPPPPPPPPPPHPIPPSLPSTSTSNGSRSGGFSNGSRSGGFTRGRAHGLLYTKDTPFSTKNRNLVDQMGTHSASPSRNGGGSSRPISRSTVGKRSPSCTEKKDKKVSSSGAIKKVKSDDSLAPPTSNGNHHLELAHGDQEHGGGGGGGGGAALMTRFTVADTDKGGHEVVEWPRIYLSLSRKEKEDDFYAMKGTKLPHRPKKRAKAVDRALQYCFPGLWLSDLTRARYEVRERKSAKKPKRRGLKGLEETMESESE